jgi:excisionase family DNA binding protein
MPEQRAFSPQEVADMAGLSRRYINKLIKQGKLSSRKEGRRRMIFLSDLEDYFGERRAQSMVKEFNALDGN